MKIKNTSSSHNNVITEELELHHVQLSSSSTPEGSAGFPVELQLSASVGRSDIGLKEGDVTYVPPFARSLKVDRCWVLSTAINSPLLLEQTRG